MNAFGKQTPVGFVGLGVMGGGMAHCLLRNGFSLHVFGRRADAVQPFVAAGAQAAASPAALGRACRLVFLCLSDDAAVEQVLFGPGGLAEGLAAGSCVVDTSTISASSARAFGERLKAKGIATCWTHPSAAASRAPRRERSTPWWADRRNCWKPASRCCPPSARPSRMWARWAPGRR
jgi:prephenate dehydrogenase